MVKMTVYELMVKLKDKKTDQEEIVELMTQYPALCHMVLTSRCNSMFMEIMKVVPEVTCMIVEDRLRMSTLKEPKPGKCIRPAGK